MKTTTSRRASIDQLLRAPWTIELRPNPDGSVFARVLEMPGCMTEAEDEARALRNIRRAMRLWLEVELEQGVEIALPVAREYSGKFVVRTSPLVHRLAAETAQRLGVSLNELASEALALVAGANSRLRLARDRSSQATGAR